MAQRVVVARAISGRPAALKVVAGTKAGAWEVEWTVVEARVTAAALEWAKTAAVGAAVALEPKATVTVAV